MTLQSTFKKQFSCEFSAPKSEEAGAKLLSAHDRLAALGPAYFSVTYGAGGSTKDGTKQAVIDIRAKEFTAGLQRMTNELKPKVEALHTEIGRVHKQQKAGKRD